MAIAPDFAQSTTPDALTRVPRALAFRCDVLPLWLSDGTLGVALPDPADSAVLDELRRATRLRVKPIRLPREQIRERLMAAYANDASPVALGDRRAADVP